MSIMLASPLSYDHHSTRPDDLVFFSETMVADDRVPTLLRPAWRAYKGSWYHQGEEPTCLPWAVLGGGLVAEVQPSPRLAADLVNLANRIGDPNKAPGMEFEEAVDILRFHPDAGIMLESSPFNIGAETKTERLMLNLVEESLRKDEIYEAYFDYFWPPDRDLTIRKNAAKIVDSLEQDYPLLLSVDYNKYRGLPSGSGISPHAICVSGYTVDEESYMDVQIIDSARGIFWMSLEHLSRSVFTQTCWRIVRTCIS